MDRHIPGSTDERGVGVTDFERASAYLSEAETAVAQGDLVVADLALKRLRPLLDLGRADHMLELKRRIDALTLDVVAVKGRSGDALRELGRKRHGADRYRAMTEL